MPIQRLSQWVAMRCKDPQFQRWLSVRDEETAVNMVRAICGIRSRAELDSNPDAAQRFHQYVRLPFNHFANNHN